MKLFNFEVYAVMVTEYDSDGNPETPELLGFWPTYRDAEVYAMNYEIDRLSRFMAHEKASAERFGGAPREPIAFFYQILPLEHVLVDGRWPLDNLEEKLVLMATGKKVTR